MSESDTPKRRMELRRRFRARRPSSQERDARSAAGARELLYGIPEIAELLEEPRGNVNAWYLRGTYGMPGPDQHVANVPVWFASSIEPWIAGRLALADADQEPPLTDDFLRDLAKRYFRLMALLLETAPRRPGLILRSSAELRELGPRLARALEEDARAAKRLSELSSVLERLPKLMPRLARPGSPEPAELSPTEDERLNEVRALLAEAGADIPWLLAEVGAGDAVPRAPRVGLRASRATAGARAWPATPAIDRARLRRLVSAIPPGRWATYGDIAGALGRPKAALSVGRMIARDGEIENAHRVLRTGGEISPDFRGEDGAGPEDAARRLRAEGVEVEGLRADPARQLRGEELADLARALPVEEPGA